ncbi:chemerin-like receptor 1 [Salminus brasiliensis]|uniref:chemerin-like receptor 1 n=1 Tax=Salminus brasiliensis TaxID=930266 RepID=UPI003B839EC8
MNQTPGLQNQTSLASQICTDPVCLFYAVANTIIFILGCAGNGLVIWIAGFKMKKSVITTWYLSLAASDFIFCCTLPFGVAQKVQNGWIFGVFMCKFRYFIKFLNMYSSIFVLLIISVDRCVLVLFPVWAQNKRTIRKASVIVVLVWIISAVISMPSLIFRGLKFDQTMRCKNMKNESRIATVSCRFVLGFVIPLHAIVISYVVIMKRLKSKQMTKSKKPFKVMTVLIATFLICWLPFHTFSFLAISYESINWIKNGKVVGITVANANSCLNPFLYAFMGKDFTKHCNTVLTKIENAIAEDTPNREEESPPGTSGDSKLLTI